MRKNHSRLSMLSRIDATLKKAARSALALGLSAAVTMAHADTPDEAAVPEEPAVAVAGAAVPGAGETGAAAGADAGEGEAVAEEEVGEEELARRRTAELCTLMTTAAATHGVPPGFFIRLIWKESRFRADAVSPVGAQGIAQFMPGTARLRGLKNPFDPREALLASAAFLADLEAQFGSWGLAAAGYNGGPNRVPRFVAGQGGLPYETVDYVFSITGRTAKYWAQRARRMMQGVFPEDVGALQGEPLPERYVAPARPPLGDGWRRRGDLAPIALPAATVQAIAYIPQDEAGVEAARRLPGPPPARPDVPPPAVDCPALVARLGQSRSVAPPTGMSGYTVWAAQVAGHPRRAVAMAQYDRLKRKLPADLVAKGPHVVVRRFAARGRMAIHAVQFGASSRGEAEALCKRIARTLAPCVVVKNS